MVKKGKPITKASGADDNARVDSVDRDRIGRNIGAGRDGSINQKTEKPDETKKTSEKK